MYETKTRANCQNPPLVTQAQSTVTYCTIRRFEVYFKNVSGFLSWNPGSVDAGCEAKRSLRAY